MRGPFFHRGDESSRVTSDFRAETVLDGEWSFRTDPDDVGRNEGWQAPGADWSDARTEAVPRCWQEYDGLADYEGVAWYRTTFEADGEGRTFVRFGAADHEATAYVNGEELGAYADGYTPFEAEATGAVEAGENVLAVRVVDPPNEEDRDKPHGKQGNRWYDEVSGLWQSVTVEERPATHVADAKVTPDLEADVARVAVEVAVGPDREGEDLAVVATVSRDGEAVAAADAPLDGDGSATLAVDLEDPDYWTPDDPTLYDLRVTVEADGEPVDASEDYFGMRSVAVEGGEFLLNGEPYRIRGALDQAFYPETEYRPPDRETVEAEVRRAKDLGFNLLREHIKVAHPDFVEAADRLGLLLWQEPANPDRYTAASRDAVRRQLRAAVDRDYNRPSVVAWSCYNEEWGIGNSPVADEESLWEDESKQAYLASLVERVREWDPTRLVCDNSGWAHVETDLNDYHEYYVAPDRAERWADRLDEMLADPGDNYAEGRDHDPDVPLVVSEFGCWGFPDAEALEERYGGEPRWYRRHEAGDMRRPAGYRERFREFGLDEVFGDLDGLREAWQAREQASNERVIAEMRARDLGYVVTQWTDLEWEFNGVLDYRREPKAFHEAFAAVNAPVTVHLEFPHVAWSGESLSGDVVVSNHERERVTGTVSWEAFGETGAVDVDVAGPGTARVEGAVEVTVPDAHVTGRTEVAASLDVDADARDASADASQSVAVVDPRDAGVGGVDLYLDGVDLPLGEFGGETVDDLWAADAVVTAHPERVTDFVEAGGAALVVPGEDGAMAETDCFEYHEYPREYGWGHAASLMYRDPDALDLPGETRVGWEFEGAYPFDAVADPGSGDEVLVGSVEGWIHDRVAPVLVRERGDGAFCVATFPVAATYGDHPTATLLFARLVERMT